ncbi:MAG: 2-amino-4-hydroxy-6-hydroxymethyldihydropteridine diphosphokinase [Thermoleophilaceae bacterium]|nr:2-amino-4-hydroxy-6-hydroxymethyldihydropteridine diphosphokinase [Thermoleophilaceae bacterium]
MRGFLGLGSNVGDRLASLRVARGMLAASPSVRVSASSPVYETAPQGDVLDQPDFLNICLEIETELDPEALLDLAKRLERELGRRQPVERHGPRSIDIDVLLLGEHPHESERLTLPHPEILRRRFVLQPLLDIDPELELPDGTRLASVLPLLADQRVERVATL